MAWYQVTLRVEVTRSIQAKDEHEALENVDHADMLHEIKNYKVDEEYIVSKFAEDDEME